MILFKITHNKIYYLWEIDKVSNNKKLLQNRKECLNMSTISKPINRITVIKLNDTPDFVKNFNKNVVTEEFLITCKKAGKLFGIKEQQ